jgi:predicted acyltransferase (DUF342 family)
MVAVSVIIISVAVGVASTAYNQYRLTKQQIDEASSFMMADSGIELALLELYRDNDYTGSTLTTPEASVAITLTDLGNDQMQLSSTTTVGGIRRRISINMDVEENPVVGGHYLVDVSVYAGDDVKMIGNDSEMYGDLHTNDGIEIQNQSILFGDAKGHSGTTRIFNNAQVQDNPLTTEVVEGNVYTIETANIFNQVHITGEVVSATAVNINGTVTIDGGYSIDPDLHIDALPVPTFNFANLKTVATAAGTKFDYAWQFDNYVELNNRVNGPSGDKYVMNGVYYIASTDTIDLHGTIPYEITGSIVSEGGDIQVRARGDYYQHDSLNGYPLLVAGDDIFVQNLNANTEVDLNGVTYSVGSSDFDHTNYSQPTGRDQGIVINGATWAGDAVLVKDKVKLVLNETYTSAIQGFDFSVLAGVWFNDDWSNRKPIVIDHTKVSGTNNLNDFPILINISSDSDLASMAQNDADDIVFTSSNGTTKLNHEIEYFDGATGQLVAWVRMPDLKVTTDTIIYMYFNSSTTTNQQNAEGVWNGNFNGVWHFATGSGNTFFDSTTNDFDAVRQLTTGTWENGAIHKAFDFNNSEYAVTSASFNAAESGSVSFWVKRTSNNTGGVMGMHDRFEIHGLSPLSFDVQINSAGEAFSGVTSLTNGDWYHITANYDSSADTYEVFTNGVSAGSGSKNLTTSTLAGTLRIGSLKSAIDAMAGSVDELRLLNVPRNSDWILTEYRNQSSPSTFYAVGVIEGYTATSDTTFNLGSWLVE